MNGQPKPQDHTFRFRSRLLRLSLMILLFLLVGRLTYIQVVQADFLEESAQNWIKVSKEVNGTRGTIYDSNGKKLVFTGVAYDINIDLARLRAEDAKEKGDTPEEYARFLAPLIGATEQEIRQRIDDALDDPKTKGIYLGEKGQKVEAEVHDKIKAMHDEDRYEGITTIRTEVRRYPNGTFASSILGYYGHDDAAKKESGRAGLEYVYNDVLAGKPGFVEYYTDLAGNPLPNYKPDLKVPAVDGQDIVLTIDENIQHFVEDELNHIVDKYGPKHASIIVADPNNGEILAMGSRPNYDPNEFAKADSEALWNNWNLRAFEPGSTFKVFVMAAALAENKLDLEETFQSGRINVGGDVVRDWNEGKGFGTISYREGVYNSSNVGFVKIGQKLGKDKLYEHIYNFGFNKPTGIDLPGEEAGLLFEPAKMREIDLASTSFGQGISVTPIQQVAAMTAVANGGKVYQPHLVKELRDHDGDTVKEIEPKVLYEIGNPEVMSTVRDVMEETVLADKVKTNVIKGYHVAGKTGTAQVMKPGGGYEDDKYRLSFIGFAPADKPRILVYVTVDQPTRNAPLQFGSLVAAPSAKVVMEQSLRYLQVPIDQEDGAGQAEAGASGEPAAPVTYVKVPDFIGGTADSVQKVAEAQGLKIETVGDGPRVTGQWPDTTYGQVPQGSEIKLYFGPEGSGDGKVKVPDLRGLSLREAMETLALLHLQVDLTGSGYVAKQGTPPGTLVPYGTSVTLELAPQS